MEAKRIRILIHILRQQGILEDSELRRLLREATTSRQLLALLEKEQLVDQDWVRATELLLRRKARRVNDAEPSVRQGDRSFGQIAISRGWIDVSTLEDAILEQQRLRRMNLRFRLGEILIQRGQLDVDQVRQLLAVQGLATAVCDRCQEILAVSEAGNQSCPVCAKELQPTLFLDVVEADR